MKNFEASRFSNLHQPEIACTSWQFSQSHRPVAQFTMVFQSRRTQRTPRKPSLEGKASIVPLLGAGAAVVISFLIVWLGTSYLYGMLLEKIQNLQYNQAQAQYSDVWK